MNHPHLENTSQFEQWLQNKISQKKSSVSELSKQAAEVVTIPVVVHIIHFGENIGVGRNIPDAQVSSQIKVLNEDFRRNNSDAGNTPSVFQPVAADVEIEFALAKRDPEGLPTNGIVRVKGNQATYEIEDNYVMKKLSYWPAEDYLNIWVADIGGGYLGYAQFPVSSLQGLEGGSEYALTDGVAIDYKAFGSVNDGAFNLLSNYNLGRTATHEIGHYLGLRHIWGDSDNCNVDDFCDDTPSTNINHSGVGSPCTFPADNNGCGSDDMFQNYMDYTDDGCMNLFTLDQKARIRAVMDHSPRRMSLKASKGADPPVVAANDLGLRTIISPGSAECETVFVPQIEIRNYGSNAVTSGQILLRIDGIVQETTAINKTLSYLDMDTLLFSSVDVTTPGSHTVEFEVVSANGVTDGNADNNKMTTATLVPKTSGLPVIADFETQPSGWTIQDLDGIRTWEIVNAPNGNTNNKALSIDFYDYEQQGEYDLFLSPTIDLSHTLTTALSFDVAYAQYSGTFNEGLIVTVSSTCDDPLNEADTVFAKFDKDLSTVSTTSYFVPSNANDWRTEFIDISQYAGNKNVRVSFIAKNNYGNNIYIDNVSIVSLDKEDISIAGLKSPGRVSCVGNQMEVTIKNTGIKAIGSFELQYALDEGNLQTARWESADSLYLSDEITISATLPGSDAGEHQLFITAINPNDVEDGNPANNSISYRFILNENSDTPPIKENFEDLNNSQWTINNPDADKTWEIVGTNKGNSIALKGSAYPNINEEDWLVSPTLDFSNLQTVSLNYNYSYSASENGAEELAVYISTDCGQHFEELGTGRSGDELSTTSSDITNYLPSLDSLWKNVEIPLIQYIGNTDVRIAFVSTNGNGNNLYLDDIQIYVSKHDNIMANTMYPNPSLGEPTNLTFDLDQKETITILVYDRTGTLILEEQKPNTLNQTYTLDLRGQTEGLYIVKVIGQSFSFVKRLMQTHSN